MNGSRRTYALAAGDGEVVAEDPAPPGAGDWHVSYADSEDGDEDPLPRVQDFRPKLDRSSIECVISLRTLIVTSAVDQGTDVRSLEKGMML